MLTSLIREMAVERHMRNNRHERYRNRKRRGGGNHPKDVLGRCGEEVAEKFLRNRGYSILARNMVMPSCELDIVAFEPKSKTILFIEVKTRRSRRWEEPWQAVNYRRKIRMVKASREYLRQIGQEGASIRFDIVSIVWPSGSDPQIEYREGAFDHRDLKRS